MEVVSVPFELAEGKFYFDKSLKLNWYQANEFCLSNKMVLATPDSPENEQRIRNFLRSYGRFNAYVSPFRPINESY